MEQSFSFIIDEEYEEERLDKVLALLLPDYSRSRLQGVIKDGLVLVNQGRCKPSTALYGGDEVIINIPEPVIPSIIPENIPLNIVFEDSDVIIVNKPKDMVVHPAFGHYTGTLVNAIMYHTKDLSGINGVLRPGIVHRIDRNTTGLLVICKNDKAHNCLAAQFKEHSIKRTYQAIIKGYLPNDEGVIENYLGRDPKNRMKYSVTAGNGKKAITHYKVLDKRNGHSLVECRLETGRTHQIRVHMASLGHPILGDDLYGGLSSQYPKLIGQTLHAKTLGFVHPTTNEEIFFDSELPEYFLKLWSEL